MAALFKKPQQEKNLEEYRDITDDVIESDFVPYACHYDTHTILTKNGELLQTLRITGFGTESGENKDLRAAIRDAIFKNVKNDKYALWFHTIRRKEDLSLKGNYPDPVSSGLHAAWEEKNRWTDQFVNEIYITVAREGQATPLLSPKDFLRGLWPPADRRYREAYLAESSEELDKVVVGMAKSLEPFGAKRLGVVERGGEFYTEPGEFLSKIINLTDEQVLLPEMDLSTYLTTQEITFGFNAMEVRSHTGKRRFGAILTLKDYKELSPEHLDRLLQLPIEFIINQCADFINPSEALKMYDEQQEILRLSGAKELAQASGLADILESRTGSPLDYGQQQLSVFLLADDLRTLGRYVHRAVTALQSLGILTVREDIRFEECYWAQLPGNFEFVKRLKPINTKRIAGFASFGSLPTGSAEGGPWKEAITLLPTTYNTPYYFHFHRGGKGHTLVVGPEDTDKAGPVNFLLSEARRLNPRIFVIDFGRASELFLRGMGGAYHRAPGMRLNPFDVTDTPESRKFLFYWTLLLLGDVSAYGEQESMVLKNAIDHLFTLPMETRDLSALSAQVQQANPEMAGRIAAWAEKGLFSADAPNPVIGDVVGFDLDALRENPEQLTAVAALLLQKAGAALDGRPTALVLHDPWAMLDNPLFGGRIEAWLNMLTSKNAIAVMTTTADDAASCQMMRSIMPNIATQIYLPDEGPVEAYRSALQLSEKESQFLGVMDETRHHVLIKRDGELLVLEMPLPAMPDWYRKLSASPDALAILDGLQATGSLEGDWLSQCLPKVAS